MKLIKAESLKHGSFKVALVVSLFNRPITAELQKGAIEQLIQQGIAVEDITVVEVPGASEIPLIVQQLAKKKVYGAIVALGAVVRGETTHYDYVCQMVSDGCSQVALTFETPVVFGVLTTEDEAQAWARLGGLEGHKGREAADCALAMHSVLKQI